MKQSECHDGKKELSKDDEVYVENFTKKNPRWIPGTIIKITGPLSYEIQLQDRTKVKRHVDHVRKREVQNPPEQVTDTEIPDVLIGPTLVPEVNVPAENGNSSSQGATPPTDDLPRQPPVVSLSNGPPSQTLLHSARNRPVTIP